MNEMSGITRLKRLWSGDDQTMLHVSSNPPPQITKEATKKEPSQAQNSPHTSTLAKISHELRNPTNGIIGIADLLSDSELSEEQRLFVRTIRNSSKALLTIINDGLKPPEESRTRQKTFDLENTISEVAMLLIPQANAKGIEIMIDYDTYIPPNFIGDESRIRQVLLNLMSNAVKFTDAGHVLVRIVTAIEDDLKCELYITVEDTGCGITSKDMPHILEKSTKLNQSPLQNNNEAELGLTISKQIIEQMGGELWAESEYGKGSYFSFRLRLPVTEDTCDPPTLFESRRVLVIDDHFTNRTILERQLAVHGVTSELCPSAEKALEFLIQDRSFDAIIVDHNMPGMDGLSFVKNLRDCQIDTPCIMLTSNALTLEKNKTHSALSAIVQKPITRSEIFQNLNKVFSDSTPSTPEHITQRTMRILVADDNRTNQMVFSKMLGDNKVDIFFANNGHEALEKFQKYRPDLVFMDLSMPEMSGYEAAKNIRQMEIGGDCVPIIALTTHPPIQSKDNSAIGINRFLTKPLRKTILKDILEEFRPNEASALDFMQPTDSTTN